MKQPIVFLFCKNTGRIHPRSVEQCPFCEEKFLIPPNHCLMTAEEFVKTGTPQAESLVELSSITLSDLANDSDTPEITNLAPVFLRFSEEKIYNGYLLITQNKCQITWWWPERLDNNVLRIVAYQFNSPNEWKRTAEELLGQDSPFQGSWDNVRVKYNGRFVTLASLKIRLFRKRQLHTKKKSIYFHQSCAFVK
jgi:hypothetical protein